jgi:hypothetical protein
MPNRYCQGEQVANCKRGKQRQKGQNPVSDETGVGWLTYWYRGSGTAPYNLLALPSILSEGVTEKDIGIISVCS